MSPETFIVDCPMCKAKVAAVQTGVAETAIRVDDGEPVHGERIHVGTCPRCWTALVGASQQTAIAGYDGFDNEWSDIVRVYPEPTRTFRSSRIPLTVRDSLREAERCLQAAAYTASCAMLGRALEGVCRDILAEVDVGTAGAKTRPIMLGQGIERLKKSGHIDERLYDWSQQLQVFRNLAAHADEAVITRQDAEDLQAFVCAIIEYIYDLTDRYNEFRARVAQPPPALPDADLSSSF